MHRELDDLLSWFLLMKETEAFLRDTLRPGKLFESELKLSDISWSSHWVWDRRRKEGEVYALYIREKQSDPMFTRKIIKTDLLGRGITLEDVYKALKQSKAEKTTIDISTILTG